mmetsp:Transcript_51388/g.111546  ORF Transcript_51388/g.111546 Transcript_51388/m.111546 type:complete len:253 (+) Transcript_51388:349-1107(+)
MEQAKQTTFQSSPRRHHPRRKRHSRLATSRKKSTGVRERSFPSTFHSDSPCYKHADESRRSIGQSRDSAWPPWSWRPWHGCARGWSSTHQARRRWRRRWPRCRWRSTRPWQPRARLPFAHGVGCGTVHGTPFYIGSPSSGLRNFRWTRFGWVYSQSLAGSRWPQGTVFGNELAKRWPAPDRASHAHRLSRRGPISRPEGSSVPYAAWLAHVRTSSHATTTYCRRGHRPICRRGPLSSRRGSPTSSPDVRSER